MNLDPSLLNTTIGSLLQSPAAAQMFFNSLNASVQGQALQHNAKAPAPSPPAPPNENDPTMALFSPLPGGLVSHNQDLIGAYQKAMNVTEDVGHLQESIDSLVRSMGLDLPNGTTGTTPTPSGPSAPSLSTDTSSIPTTSTTIPDPSLAPEGTFDDQDFNVDEFLDQLAKSNEGGPSEETTDL